MWRERRNLLAAAVAAFLVAGAAVLSLVSGGASPQASGKTGASKTSQARQTTAPGSSTAPTDDFDVTGTKAESSTTLLPSSAPGAQAGDPASVPPGTELLCTEAERSDITQAADGARQDVNAEYDRVRDDLLDSVAGILGGLAGVQEDLDELDVRKGEALDDIAENEQLGFAMCEVGGDGASLF